jgi:SPP1 gp7 family putative phage head morphogenesis protein
LADNIEQVIARAFAEMKAEVIKQVDHYLPAKAKAATKASKLLKAIPARPIVDDLIQTIMEELDATFAAIGADIVGDLREAALAGVQQGVVQLSITGTDMLASTNDLASTWAKERAAELVGKKWVDGVLVDNPNAEWVITDTTRDKLHDLVQEAFDNPEFNRADFLDSINNSGIFDPTRAQMIARTEVSMAQNNGNMEMWRASGVVRSVEWYISNAEGVCEECDENDREVRVIGELFPTGDAFPPVHPNCRCILATASLTEPPE